MASPLNTKSNMLWVLILNSVTCPKCCFRKKICCLSFMHSSSLMPEHKILIHYNAWKGQFWKSSNLSLLCSQTLTVQNGIKLKETDNQHSTKVSKEQIWLWSEVLICFWFLICCMTNLDRNFSLWTNAHTLSFRISWYSSEFSYDKLSGLRYTWTSANHDPKSIIFNRWHKECLLFFYANVNIFVFAENLHFGLIHATTMQEKI